MGEPLRRRRTISPAFPTQDILKACLCRTKLKLLKPVRILAAGMRTKILKARLLTTFQAAASETKNSMQNGLTNGL